MFNYLKLFYDTPGDELDFFIFNGSSVPYEKVKRGGKYLIRVIGGRAHNIGNSTTYGSNGIASLFKFSSGPNEFGNVIFEDEVGIRLVLKEFPILDGSVLFYKSS
jgi:hypothetical protein